ncbi:MAG: hypothetical protein L0H83_03475 [Salinisphaera sp.]|nr:hypothetical protein [Salinisphaera sp.]
MPALSDFRLDVFAQLRECPAPVVDRNVIRAAIVLCQRAPIWTETLADITLTAGTSEYTLAPSTAITSAGGEIIRPVLDGVRYRQRPLRQLSLDAANVARPGWTQDQGKEPTQYVMLSPRNLTLIPIPEDTLTDPLQVQVSVRPSRKATTMPDVLYDHWYDAITSGALQFLLSMPKTPWSDPGAALYHRRIFLNEQTNARAQYERGYGDGSARVWSRPFVSRRR